MNFFNNLKKITRLYRYKINHFFFSFRFTQDSYLLFLGGIIGVIVGFGAVIFHEAIKLIKELFFDLPGEFFGVDTLIGSDSWYIIIILILIPAIGGLLVGLLTHFFEGGKKGEGIPTVIDAVASKNGLIKGTVAILKTIGSALSIGTGGAGGREGPIVQIGAAIGSSIGQYLSSTSERLKILVGCGAAAGLSAAFNAPIGGALFSMEIILRTFNAKSFSPIIIASVFATVISRNFLGDQPAFSIPTYELISNYELFFYLVLGLLAAFTSVYFVKVFLKIDDKFDQVKNIPNWFRPAIGGLMVGVIGIGLPGVYGFNYEALTSSFSIDTSVLLLVLLLIFKPIATGLTIGSGGNGGTFAPSIFTGAMLGAAFGHLVNYLFPEISAPPGAYALVGMGAVVAGTTHASLTALIMVFEMTNNYRIILPLMMTIIIATTFSRIILKGSLYTIKFDREGRGIDIYGRKISVLKAMNINKLIEKYDDVVSETFSFKRLLTTVRRSRFNTILVKNKEDRLVGQISFQDIRNAILNEETRNILNFLVAGDLMIGNLPTITNDKTAEEALNLMEKEDMEFVPVIDKKNERFLGIISKQDLLKRYQYELFLQQSEQELAV